MNFEIPEYDTEDRAALVSHLGDVLTKAFEDSITIQEDQYHLIDGALSSAKKEVNECEKAMSAIEDITNHIQTSVISQLRQDIQDLHPMFNTIDSMQQIVIPALNADLDNLEVMLNELEKLHSQAFPNTIQTIFKAIKFTEVSRKPLPVCDLHDPLLLIRLLDQDSNKSNQV